MKKRKVLAVIIGALLLELLLLMVASAPVYSVSREQEEVVAAYSRNPTAENKANIERVFYEKNKEAWLLRDIAFGAACVLPLLTIITIVRMRRVSAFSPAASQS